MKDKSASYQFKAMGYERYENDHIIEYTKNTMNYPDINILETITFNKDIRMVTFNSFDRVNFKSHSFTIDMQMLKAVNKQQEELECIIN